MMFRLWLETTEKRSVLAHIAGPSASGKTTLVDKINRNHRHVVAKDLDDFDEAARAILGWSRIDKKDYTAKMFDELHAKCQELLDDFLRKSEKPVVLCGHATEGDWKYDLPKDAKRFVLDVDPEVVAQRIYERGMKGVGDRFNKKDLPALARDAAKEIQDLQKNGHELRKDREILGWIKSKKP
jgi:hypothetical protein